MAYGGAKDVCSPSAKITSVALRYGRSRVTNDDLMIFRVEHSKLGESDSFDFSSSMPTRRTILLFALSLARLEPRLIAVDNTLLSGSVTPRRSSRTPCNTILHEALARDYRVETLILRAETG